MLERTCEHTMTPVVITVCSIAIIHDVQSYNYELGELMYNHKLRVVDDICVRNMILFMALNVN